MCCFLSRCPLSPSYDYLVYCLIYPMSVLYCFAKLVYQAEFQGKTEPKSCPLPPHTQKERNRYKYVPPHTHRHIKIYKYVPPHTHTEREKQRFILRDSQGGVACLKFEGLASRPEIQLKVDVAILSPKSVGQASRVSMLQS